MPTLDDILNTDFSAPAPTPKPAPRPSSQPSYTLDDIMATDFSGMSDFQSPAGQQFMETPEQFGPPDLPRFQPTDPIAPAAPQYDLGAFSRQEQARLDPALLQSRYAVNKTLPSMQGMTEQEILKRTGEQLLYGDAEASAQEMIGRASNTAVDDARASFDPSIDRNLAPRTEQEAIADAQMASRQIYGTPDNWQQFYKAPAQTPAARQMGTPQEQEIYDQIRRQVLMDMGVAKDEQRYARAQENAAQEDYANTLGMRTVGQVPIAREIGAGLASAGLGVGSIPYALKDIFTDSEDSKVIAQERQRLSDATMRAGQEDAAPERLRRNLMGATESLATSALGGRFGPRGAAAAGGLTSFSGAVGEGQRAGLSRTQTLINALAQGGLEVGLELGAQKLGLGGIDDILGGATASTAKQGFLEFLTKTYGKEALTEIPTGELQNAAATFISEGKLAKAEGRLDRTIDTLLQTAISSGSTATFQRLAEKVGSLSRKDLESIGIKEPTSLQEREAIKARIQKQLLESQPELATADPDKTVGAEFNTPLSKRPAEQPMPAEEFDRTVREHSLKVRNQMDAFDIMGEDPLEAADTAARKAEHYQWYKANAKHLSDQDIEDAWNKQQEKIAFRKAFLAEYDRTGRSKEEAERDWDAMQKGQQAPKPAQEPVKRMNKAQRRATLEQTDSDVAPRGDVMAEPAEPRVGIQGIIPEADLQEIEAKARSNDLAREAYDKFKASQKPSETLTGALPFEEADKAPDFKAMVNTVAGQAEMTKEQVQKQYPNLTREEAGAVLREANIKRIAKKSGRSIEAVRRSMAPLEAGQIPAEQAAKELSERFANETARKKAEREYQAEQAKAKREKALPPLEILSPEQAAQELAPKPKQAEDVTVDPADVIMKENAKRRKQGRRQLPIPAEPTVSQEDVVGEKAPAPKVEQAPAPAEPSVKRIPPKQESQKPSASEQAMRDADERGNVEAQGSLGGNIFAEKSAPEDKVNAAILPDDPEAARAIVEAYGIKKPSLKDKLKDIGKWTWQRVSRSYANIPSKPGFFTDQEDLRQFNVNKEVASDEASRRVASVFEGLGPKQLQAMSFYATAADQLRHLDNGGKIYMKGMKSRADVEAYKAKMQKVVDATPEIKSAVERRAEANKRLLGELVENGLLPKELSSEDYMHRQVLKYAEAKAQGGGLLGKKGFQKERDMDSEFDEENVSNTNLLESEIEWVTDAIAQIKNRQWLESFMKRNDASASYRAKRKAGMSEKAAAKAMEKEGYVSWRAGSDSLFVPRLSYQADVAHEMMNAVLEGQSQEVKDAAGFGPNYWLRPEIAAQLNEMKHANRGSPAGEAARAGFNFMKKWQLFGPWNYVKYFLRNMWSDMEITATYPKSWLYSAEATKEVWGYVAGNKIGMSDDVRLARDLGVLDASQAAQSLNPTELRIFKHLMDGEQSKAAQLYTTIADSWNSAIRLQATREAVMRLAVFKAMRAELKKNGKPVTYLASNPARIDELLRTKGNDVAAARMANDLLGNYKELTVLGDNLRKYIAPYWGFTEANAKRYSRLIANAFQESAAKGTKAAGLAGAGVLTAASAKMLAGSLASWAWNALMYPEEEEELSLQDQAADHLVFGKNKEGKIDMLRGISGLKDFTEWTGFNTLMALQSRIASGQISVKDALLEAAKAPVNKLVGSVGSHIKTPIEALMGRSVYPDVFKTQQIDDRMEHLASAAGPMARDAYREIKGRITGDGTRARTGLRRILFDISDNERVALGSTMDALRDFKRSKGQAVDELSRTSPFKNMRDAARNGDQQAFEDARRAWIKDGKSLENVIRSLSSLDPTRGISDKELLKEFEQKFLNVNQKKQLEVARKASEKLEQNVWEMWRKAEENDPPEVADGNRDERLKYIGSNAAMLMDMPSNKIAAGELNRPKNVDKTASDIIKQKQEDEKAENEKALKGLRLSNPSPEELAEALLIKKIDASGLPPKQGDIARALEAYGIDAYKASRVSEEAVRQFEPKLKELQEKARRKKMGLK